MPVALQGLLVPLELRPHDSAGEGAAPQDGREVDEAQQADNQGVGVLDAGALEAELDEAQ